MSHKGKPATYRAPIAERFWAKVDKTGSCWVWTACKFKDGYGNFRGERGKVRAHRAVWEMANGPVPPGLQVLHECDNRVCVNPSHLFLGTNIDNNQDMIRKGRARYPGPKRPVRGEASPNAVLCTKDVRTIRERSANGETYTSIAADYGVSINTISNIVNMKAWAHV